MHYWLIKFAPFRTSWQEIVQQGTFTLRGVKSHLARKHLSAMHLGDYVLFSRSQREPALMGLLQVTRPAYPDPTAENPYWLTCDFQPLETFKEPIPLYRLREESSLQQLRLLKQPRLSVMPLQAPEWLEIKQIAGMKRDDTKVIKNVGM